MFNQRSRIFFLIVIVAALVVPVLVALRYPVIGGALFLVGATLAWRNMRLVLLTTHDRDPADQRRRAQAREQARMIFVQLVDDQGNDLDPATCESRLAAARLHAGPRDTVIGVRRKVP
ncbi:MAG: hypothetical protein HGB28_01855 [Oscillochloris sp.]|nr:hypothetical protein [Oscillochloris sp.]